MGPQETPNYHRPPGSTPWDCTTAIPEGLMESVMQRPRVVGFTEKIKATKMLEEILVVKIPVFMLFLFWKYIPGGWELEFWSINSRGEGSTI